MNPIAVDQLQFLIQQTPALPLPAEATAIPGSPHVSSDLLFHPVFHEPEALVRVSNSEVIHPSPQHGIDELSHPICRLRSVSPEHFLELTQQRRALLQPGRILRSPNSVLYAADSTEVESQKAEALCAVQIHSAALLFINLDLQFGKLFPKSLAHRPQQPRMAWMGIDQHDEIISKAGVLDIGVLPVALGFFRTLQP